MSLPIPQNKVYSKDYYFIFNDQTKASKKSMFILKKRDTIHALRTQIKEQLGMDPWSFVIARISDDDCDEMFCRNKTIGDLSENKGFIFVFEMP